MKGNPFTQLGRNVLLAEDAKIVGITGDTTVSIDHDGSIAISQDDDIIVLPVTDAVYLTVLIDQAIGLTKGGVKMNPTGDLG